MRRVCFVSLKSYDLLSDNPNPRFIGGAERQQVLIAKGLQRLGHDVSFVTLDYGQPDGIEHNGIRIYKAYHPDAGLPGLRAFSPRWKGLIAALRRADADIYHQMCADSETGQVALWCRRNNRRFIFATASDADCVPALPLLNTRRQRWFYRYGLRRADHVVTQTHSQQNTLRKNFGMQSTLIASCTNDPQKANSVASRFPKSERLTCVWVSRIVPLKRLEWLLDVAEKCPNYSFIVVGGGNESDPYVKNVVARGQTIPNVKMAGRISDRELWDAYDRADLLLDSACVAGVPTTFLEAWARGVPVVSTVNPDEVVTLNNLGLVVSTVEEMVSAVVRLQSTPQIWTECARAARRYYEEHHTIETIASAYSRLFADFDVGYSLGQLRNAATFTS